MHAATITTNERTIPRSATAAGIGGPIVFVILIALNGTMTDGYSHRTQAISELGATGAQYQALQIVNFVVIGTAVLAFAWALRAAFATTAGPALVAFFGVSAGYGNAIFPCDAGCQGETTIGLLHNLTGLLGFLAMLSGMWLLARIWSERAHWQEYAVLTRRAVALGIVALIAFVATQATGSDTIDGLLQRVFVGTILGWMAWTSLRMRRMSN